MITNVQLIKMLLGLQLIDGTVTYLGEKKVTLTGSAITMHGNAKVELKWNDLDIETVKAYWPEFSALYNKQVMCVANNNEYLTELLSEAHSKVLKYMYSDVLDMRLITLVNGGHEYRIVATSIYSKDSLFVVNSTHLPQTDHHTCTPTMRVENICGDLTLRHVDDVDGMCVYALGLSAQELFEMLGFDLFHKVDFFGTVLKGREITRDSSIKRNDFAEIARMIYTSESLDAKYNRLIRALKCLGDDVPEKLNAVLTEL